MTTQEIFNTMKALKDAGFTNIHYNYDSIEMKKELEELKEMFLDYLSNKKKNKEMHILFSETEMQMLSDESEKSGKSKSQIIREALSLYLIQK